MESTGVLGEKSSRLFDELSAHNLKFAREHSIRQTIPVECITQWSSEQNERRLSSHETLKSDRSEHPMWTSSICQVEHQPTTMSIQFGTQQHQHQHHHSHSHLHYYAPADVQLRNEASSQELNYYRTYQDQYYTGHHAQATDPCKYQASNVMNTNHNSTYSVSVQELPTSSNEYQSSAVYNQKNSSGIYCQQHRTYQPQSITSESLTHEASLNYPLNYPNHRHLEHQNYDPTINNIESLHNQSRSHATLAMEVEASNNMGPTRSEDPFGHNNNSTSTIGYRDYYARQYNNSSSYQYPAQERYISQIISQSQSTTTLNQYQNEHRQQPSSETSECPPGGVILLAKAKKEQTFCPKKRVRDSNTRRQVTLDSKTRSILNSSRSTALQTENKPNLKINQCHICNRHYARPSTLKTHLRTHTNERPYKCTVCCKTFSQAANLTAHQRVHTGERPFPCPICGRQFSQSSSVITHLRTHSGERPYRCNMCHRTFSDSSTLTKHCRIHSGEKPYQCEYCQLNFSQSGNLSRHIRLHLLNGIRNPLRVSTPAGETLLQARQTLATTSSSNVNIPPNFSSSSSNSSSTSAASF